MRTIILLLGISWAAFGQCGSNATLKPIGGGRYSCVPNLNILGNAATATSLAGGSAGQYPYQSAAGVTGFRTPNAANGPVVLDASGNAVIGTTVLSPTASVIAPVTVTTGAAGQTIAATGGVYINDTAGAITYTLPTAAAGVKVCVRNAATRTGAITANAPAATTIDKEGAVNSTPGSIASGGALGDMACFVGQAAGKYLFFGGTGTWTNN